MSKQQIWQFIQVHDLRPAAARPNFTDVSTVEKFELGDSEYESLPNSVLAWKKSQGLGRFNPSAPPPEELVKKRAEADSQVVKDRSK